MSEHTATIRWALSPQDQFTYETYSRDHVWSFESGIEIKASAAPLYYGNPALVDPEQAFVASLSSCHMLTFLALAAQQDYRVVRYVDRATGILDRDVNGRLSIIKAYLRPRIDFDNHGSAFPIPDQIKELHAQAHKNCFIANSVHTLIEIVSPQ